MVALICSLITQESRLTILASAFLIAGGKLSSIHQSIKGKTPNEIAAYLEKDEDLAKIHKQV